jgi:hypothetical protein
MLYLAILWMAKVFWRIYAWFNAFGAILSMFFAVEHSSLPVVFDALISVLAAVAVLMFAFGKRAGNPTAWKIISAVFILYDLLYITYLDPALGGLSTSTKLTAITVSIILSVPAYFALVMFARGKMNKYQPSKVKPRNAVVAGVLSFLLAGVGHMYLGRWQRGITWLLLSLAIIIGASGIHLQPYLFRYVVFQVALICGLDAAKLARTGKPLFA